MQQISIEPYSCYDARKKEVNPAEARRERRVTAEEIDHRGIPRRLTESESVYSYLN